MWNEKAVAKGSGGVAGAELQLDDDQGDSPWQAEQLSPQTLRL